MRMDFFMPDIAGLHVENFCTAVSMQQVCFNTLCDSKTIRRFLRTLKMKLPYDPAIPLLGIYPDKTVI